jgi:DNA (cytosine-5)-methyltransferase 1
MRQNVALLSQNKCVNTVPTIDSASRIESLMKLYGTAAIATRLGSTARTVERWAKGESRVPGFVAKALDHEFGLVASAVDRTENDRIPFIDLFAGIGGIRLGIESAGGECVFTSEWDKYAVKTYSENHVSSHEIVGDIRSVQPAEIPDHDILAAGFPCQPFSLAGVSKKNSLGRVHGFLDPTQGTLFFNIAEILAEKRPRAFLLENVKNLISHDRGNTFRVIQDVLSNDLGYTLQYKVIDAKGYLPQHRERIILAGFRDGGSFDWADVAGPAQNAPKTMGAILHPEIGPEPGAAGYVDPDTGLVLDRYILSDRLWAYLQSYAAKHKAAGNGFGYGIVDRESTSRTLSARYYKDGSEVLVSRGEGLTPRRLTPRECARLMGFGDRFRIPVSDTQAYRQFGNSVAVPVIAAVAEQIVRVLRDEGTSSQSGRAA